MKKQIRLLYSFLNENKIILDAINMGVIFNDEPRFFQYTANLNKNFEGLKNYRYDVTVGGLSFISQDEAVLKCLMEALERFCLFYQQNDHIYSSFKKLNTALDPQLYLPSANNIHDIKFRWVEGLNIDSGSKTYIPKQLIYLNYMFLNTEPLLTTVISTGGAAGFDKFQTILQGIYEVVERDAFMTMFLNQIKAPQINLESIISKEIANIYYQCSRYNLELKVFDITNDLEIPTFLTLLIDKTGAGPALTIGAKSDFNITNAIKGSIEESFMARPWIRMLMIKNDDDLSTKIDMKQISTREQRGLYWSSKGMLRNLDYLLKNPKKNDYNRRIKKSGSIKKNYVKAVNLINGKGFDIYIKNITNKFLKNTDYRAYKVIIPRLQPLYLFKKEHNIERLKQVSRFFGQKKFRITNLPHPFL